MTCRGGVGPPSGPGTRSTLRSQGAAPCEPLGPIPFAPRAAILHHILCFVAYVLGAPSRAWARVRVRAGEAITARGAGIGGDWTRMHTTIASVAFALSLAGGAVTLTAAPIEDLSGYWSGSGSVTLSNGRTESVKCAVT